MSSPNEVPIGIRVSVNNADQAYSNLKKLHDELNRGEISIQDYKKGLRENSTLLNSNTKLWSESKAAIYATNPTLLELSRTMSGFGQITQAASTGMTAINTALLLMQGNSDAINQTKIKMAEMQNQLDQLTASGQGGTVMAQNLRNGIAQLNTVLGNQMQQQWMAQVQAIISFGAAIGAVGVQIPNAIVALKTLLRYTGAIPAISDAAAASNSVLAASQTAAAASSGELATAQGAEAATATTATAATGALSVAVKALNAAIMASPLVLAFIGALQAGGAIGAGINNLTGQSRFNQQSYTQWSGQPTLNDQINSFLSNPIGTIVNGIGGIFGNNNLLPSAYGLSSTNSTGQMQGTLTTQLDTQQQIRDAQLQAGAVLTSSNDNLVTINTSIGTTNSSINNLQTAMTAGLQAQKDATNAALQSLQQQMSQKTQELQTMKAQAAQLAAQPQTQLGIIPNGGEYQGESYDTIGQVATPAANALASLNTQMDQAQQYLNGLQQQAQNIVTNAATSGILDVSSSGVQATLSSIGLDSSSGIGSIIAGALGNGQGSGGYAGINAQQLQQFAATGDYGVFSKAVLSDNAAQAAQTGTANEAQALYNSYRSMGLSATDAANQVNAVSRNSGGQVGRATVTNTTGGVTFAAGGFEGMVSSPTMFMAGEKGPEYLSIIPSGKRGGGVTIVNNITIQGSLLSDNDLTDKINSTFKDSLKSAGFR